MLIQQSIAQSVEDFIKLPPDTLIGMAVKKLKDPSFDLKDFDEIEIWADEDDVVVYFEHSIRFIPSRGQYYYSATVNLLSGTTGHSIMGGPDKDELEFFRPTEKHKEKIQFVLDAINGSNGEVGKIPKGKRPNGQMTIIEKAAYYEISVTSKSSHSDYKIKKGTGKVYDARHKHLIDREYDSKRKRIY